MADYSGYVNAGLGAAQSQLNKNLAQGFIYPEYVSSQKDAPTQENYYNYTPTAPLAQIQSPNYSMSAGEYQGLMGGDYDKLQSALTTPGQNAATTAYNQGYNTLTNTMGGRGLYGSSIMQNHATNNLDSVYQQALANNAANAAAQRYGMEQAGLIDMNKFNLTREDQLNDFLTNKYKLDQTQNLNTYNSGADEATRRMAYDQGSMNWNQSYDDKMRDWKNNSAYEKYVYDLTRQQASDNFNTNKLNQALALAGGGSQLVGYQTQADTANNNLLMQQYLANQKAQQAEQTGWANLGVNLGAGLLNSGVASDIGGGLLDMLGDSIFDFSGLTF
jgi:hypothetical protein